MILYLCMLVKNSIGHFSVGEVFKTKGEDHTGRPQAGKYSATKSNQHPNSQEKIQKKAGHCLPMPSSYKVAHSQR